ncbi:MAG: uroporphyrinogen-III synthase [Ignavibacteriales bacterium]|nr:uroporphyrinogen-III synthase [Ignavibacteriales bacterium]
MNYSISQNFDVRMTTKNKIEIKKNDKLERIIDAASKLFSENNFHKVMMGDVAKSASIAKGTLYNYFNSKEDLYFSIMLMRMEKLINSLREKISRETNAIDSLYNFIIHNYMFMMKYDCFFMMLRRDTLKASNKICSKLKIKTNELREVLNEIIENGKKENVFSLTNSSLAVDTIIGGIYGAVERGIEHKIPRNKLSGERENLFEILLRSLISEKSKHVLPLIGKTIVTTGSKYDSNDSLKFQKLGAKVITFPTLEITPVDDWTAFDSIIKDFSKIDFIIFTSANSVKYFSARCKELDTTLNFEKITTFAVGKKTANACEKNKIIVDIIPEEFSSAGIIDALANLRIKDKNIFLPGSEIARNELPEKLKEKGANVITASIYKVGIPAKESLDKKLALLKSAEPDLFVFTSPSTFNNFLDILNITEPKKYFNGYDIAAIGPTTKREIERHNVTVKIIPQEHTLDGLVDSIVKYYTS